MIQQITQLISTPAFWALVVLGILYCAFMAYVDSLDAPTASDSKSYKHWFKFANRLAFRLKRAEVLAHIPQEEPEKSDAAGAGK